MRFLTPLTLSILLTAPQAFGRSCVDLFRTTPVSKSTERNVFEYSQPKGRMIEEYYQQLERGYKAAVEKLKPGQTYFDGGAGLGIATLQVAHRHPGVRAIAANLKNFLEQFLEFAGRFPNARFQEHDPKVNKVLADLSVALGKPIRDVATARAEIARLKAQGFDYREGLVQDTLRAMIARGEKIDLYVDVWGAYSYSADRAELIQLIYRSLADHGEAHLLSQNQLVHDLGVMDHRIFPKKNSDETVNFEEHLASLKDPAITIVGEWPETIVIRKIPGRESLDLGLRMMTGTVQFSNGAGFPIGVRYESR